MLKGTDILTDEDMLVLAVPDNYLFKNIVTFFSLNFDHILTNLYVESARVVLTSYRY